MSKYTEKLDNFIIYALNKYCYVENPWDELKKVTGNDCEIIISIKSVIPDLVLKNKEKINKNKCFLPFIDNNKDNTFPRIEFHIPKKRFKNKSLQNKNEVLNNQNKALESKEIEENNINNIGNNLIEKNDKINKEIYIQKKDESFCQSKNENYIFNNFVLKNIGLYNNINFRTFLINQLMNNNFKSDFNRPQNRNIEVNLDFLFNNNKERRNWEIIDINNNNIQCFNNEQLYYFLKEMFNSENFNYDFYIRDSIFNQNYYDLRLVYNFLKNKYNKY